MKSRLGSWQKPDIYLVWFILIVCLKEISSADVQSTTQRQTDPLTVESNQIRIRCESHQNCSFRIFTLDSYCCHSSGYCCNWFEFMVTYPTTSTQLIPYKSPTLLTIITLLILIICILFISYCFSILFCYCFKCGLFKKPNLIVITELTTSTNNTSDSTSAEIISPKYSSTSSSGSFTSSSESPCTRPQRQRPKPKKSRYTPSAPPVAGSSGQSRRIRSPTARASNTRYYTKPNCYLDYENESPFLIPQINSNKVNSKSSNRRSNQYRSSSCRTSQMQHNVQVQTPCSSRSSSSLDLGVSINEVARPSAPNYYLDEKPPSYDDIIGARR